MSVRGIRNILAVIAVVLLGWGAYLGLVGTPPDRMMGDVYRILYVHVPSAWMALVAFTITFITSVGYLFKRSVSLDAVSHASAEVGVLFSFQLLATGSIWGRPTWGVWWTWDPRLTTAAIMFVAYFGYLALRQFVDDPERRAMWSAVVSIIIYVDIPLVWYSVNWWNTLHQMKSSPETMAPEMVSALRVNSFAQLALMLTFLLWRYGLCKKQLERELAPPEAI